MLANVTQVGLASGPGCAGAAGNYGAFVRLADRGVLEQITVWLNNGGGKGLDATVQVGGRMHVLVADGWAGGVCGGGWRWARKYGGARPPIAPRSFINLSVLSNQSTSNQAWISEAYKYIYQQPAAASTTTTTATGTPAAANPLGMEAVEQPSA